MPHGPDAVVLGSAARLSQQHDRAETRDAVAVEPAPRLFLAAEYERAGQFAGEHRVSRFAAAHVQPSVAAVGKNPSHVRPPRSRAL